MKLTRWVLAGVIGASMLAGCGNRHSVNDVQIRNAPGLAGPERRAVCDVCQAHSECGTSADASLWATEHYRKTGHHKFTRESCRTALGEDWSMGSKSGQRHERPSLQELRARADQQLPPGTTINNARLSIGDAGVVDREDAGGRTIRFRQTISDGTTTLVRDVWADFDSIGYLTTARYGPWMQAAN